MSGTVKNLMAAQTEAKNVGWRNVRVKNDPDMVVLGDCLHCERTFRFRTPGDVFRPSGKKDCPCWRQS